MLTAKYVVDMGNGNLEMSVEDQKVTFNLFKAMKHPSDERNFFNVKAIEHEVENVMQQFTVHSPLEKAIVNSIECLTNKEKISKHAWKTLTN